MKNLAVIKYSINEKEIVLTEIIYGYEILSSGLLKIKNLSTDMFFTITSLQDLKDKIYDLASKYFYNWNEEIAFDYLYFGEEGNKANFYKPIYATITKID